MNTKQWQWLLDAAMLLPELFSRLENEEGRVEHTLGERIIGTKRVRLLWQLTEVDSGGNPLKSHASVNYPNVATVPERPDTQHISRSGPRLKTLVEGLGQRSNRLRFHLQDLRCRYIES